MEKYIVTKHFRCSQEEALLINERAKNERKSVSSYVRDACLNRAEIKIPKEAMEVLEAIKYNELKIGTNINQAVRLCNTSGTISRADYELLRNYLIELMELRKGLIKELDNISETR